MGRTFSFTPQKRQHKIVVWLPVQSKQGCHQGCTPAISSRRERHTGALLVLGQQLPSVTLSPLLPQHTDALRCACSLLCWGDHLSKNREFWSKVGWDWEELPGGTINLWILPRRLSVNGGTMPCPWAAEANLSRLPQTKIFNVTCPSVASVVVVYRPAADLHIQRRMRCLMLLDHIVLSLSVIYYRFWISA